MDVLHRILATTGLEVELSASPHALAARRRETLSNFLDVAARFASLDGDASLLAFLGFLRTAAQYEKGLDNALPGAGNTVKVLTAHKSKGLEWDVVAVPGLVAGQFPSSRAREAWTAQPQVLPHALRGDADTLPAIDTWDAPSLRAFKRGHEGPPAHGGAAARVRDVHPPPQPAAGVRPLVGALPEAPPRPSDFLHALYDHCAAGHGEIEAWAEEPEEDAENPALTAATADRVWPLPLDPESLARRRAARDTVLAHLEELRDQPYDRAAAGRRRGRRRGRLLGPRPVPLPGCGRCRPRPAPGGAPQGPGAGPRCCGTRHRPVAGRPRRPVARGGAVARGRTGMAGRRPPGHAPPRVRTAARGGAR